MLRERQQADVVADHLAVESEGVGERAGARLQPVVEEGGERGAVQTREHRVEHRVGGHFIKGLRAGFARQTEQTPLLRVQGRGEPREGGNVPPAGQ